MDAATTLPSDRLGHSLTPGATAEGGPTHRPDARLASTCAGSHFSGRPHRSSGRAGRCPEHGRSKRHRQGRLGDFSPHRGGSSGQHFGLACHLAGAVAGGRCGCRLAQAEPAGQGGGFVVPGACAGAVGGAADGGRLCIVFGVGFASSAHGLDAAGHICPATVGFVLAGARHLVDFDCPHWHLRPLGLDAIRILAQLCRSRCLVCLRAGASRQCVATLVGRIG